MVQSDGCRFTNTRGSSDTWSAPRYGNERGAVTIYVSRKDDVARMDEFIGPQGLNSQAVLQG